MSTTPPGSDDQVQQEIERTKSEAAQLASTTAESAKQRGRDTLDRAKEQTADRAEEVASALESTADDLESSDGEEAISGYGRSMAEMMRHFAGGLREHEIEEFAGQLAGFARRNPASFLAGSVALGFGVSRFLKATSTRPDEEYGFDDEEYLLESDEEDFGAESELAAEQPGYTGAGVSSGGTDTWPEDRGRERPGAGAGAGHWSPVVSDEVPPRPSGPSISSGQPGVGETSSERLEARSHESRRNQT